MNTLLNNVMVILAFSCLNGCQGPAIENNVPNKLDRQLATAAGRGDIALMDECVRKGANPNASDADGLCLLGIAYSYRNEVGFEHLLKLGANPHQADLLGGRLINRVSLNP